MLRVGLDILGPVALGLCDLVTVEGGQLGAVDGGGRVGGGGLVGGVGLAAAGAQGVLPVVEGGDDGPVLDGP